MQKQKYMYVAQKGMNGGLSQMRFTEELGAKNATKANNSIQRTARTLAALRGKFIGAVR